MLKQSNILTKVTNERLGLKWGVRGEREIERDRERQRDREIERERKREREKEREREWGRESQEWGKILDFVDIQFLVH